MDQGTVAQGNPGTARSGQRTVPKVAKTLNGFFCSETRTYSSPKKRPDALASGRKGTVKRLVDVEVLKFSASVIAYLLTRWAGLCTHIGFLHDVGCWRISVQHLVMHFRVNRSLGSVPTVVIGFLHDLRCRRISVQHLVMHYRVNRSLGSVPTVVIGFLHDLRCRCISVQHLVMHFRVDPILGGIGQGQTRQGDEGHGQRKLYDFGGHFEVLAIRSETGFLACAKSTS